GIYADGSFNELSGAMRVAGAATAQKVTPTPVIVSQNLASERFVIYSGDLWEEGQVRAITDVDPTSNDAALYAELVPQVVGELATVPGLSGFVSGQALAYGMVHGDSVARIAKRLKDPGVFSSIATSPWDSRGPAQGTLIFRALLAQFLPDNLIPAGSGASSEPYEGQFFQDGAWEPAAPQLFSPLPIDLAGNSGSSESATGNSPAAIQNPAGGGTDAGTAAAAKLRAQIASGPVSRGRTPTRNRTRRDETVERAACPRRLGRTGRNDRSRRTGRVRRLRTRRRDLAAGRRPGAGAGAGRCGDERR